MTNRQACGVLIAWGDGAWRVLLSNQPVTEANGETHSSWSLPYAPLSVGQSADAVASRLITRESGQRLLPAEFLQLGWYNTSADSGADRTVSALVTIIPEAHHVGATVESSAHWMPLQSVLSHHELPEVDPLSWQIIRDAAYLTPSDALREPAIVGAGEFHVPSMLSLLHSVRERTGGVTPEMWDMDLQDIEQSHRAGGGDFLVAALNNFVVAMVGVRPVTRTCAELAWLMVHPRWRNRGLGQKMIKVAERRAAELGFQTMALDSSYMHGQGQQMFRKSGYHRMPGRVPDSGPHFGASKQLSSENLELTHDAL